MRWIGLILTVSVLVNVGLVSHYMIGKDPVTEMLFRNAEAQLRATGGGGYVVTSARESSNNEALWIVDNREKRLMVFEEKKKSLTPVAKFDLRKALGANVGDVFLMPMMISSSTEAVVVIDPVGKKMVGLVLGRKGGITRLGAIDLDVVFKK